MFSKAVNIGLIALGLSRPIHWFMTQTPEIAVKQIIREATFNLSEGAFHLESGLSMYGPGAAAIALGKLKSYLFRHFPVR